MFSKNGNDWLELFNISKLYILFLKQSVLITLKKYIYFLIFYFGYHYNLIIFTYIL